MYLGRYKILRQKSVQAGSLLNIRVFSYIRKDITSEHMKAPCNQSDAQIVKNEHGANV